MIKLNQEQINNIIALDTPKARIDSIVKSIPESAVAAEIDEAILDYVDSDWEYDGEYDSEYDWYQDHGNNEAEDDVAIDIRKRIKLFADKHTIDISGVSDDDIDEMITNQFDIL